MDHTKIPVDEDASTQLAFVANILTIIAALLQLTAILADLCQRLHAHKDSKAATRPDFACTYSHTSLRPVASYVVRQELQQQVEQRVYEARAAGGSHSSIVVLVGLGGAGKSQLALNYIQTHRTEYSAVFWVDARLRESLERDYVQIACLLSGHGHEHDHGSASAPLDMNQVVTSVKTWFAGRGGRFLFVYDNADSLDDESDHYFVDLQRYLPDAPGVEIVITTRSQTAAGMTELEAIEVGKLAPTEAVEVFIRCGELGNAGVTVREEAALIVAELDHLALAVTLAGAYVAATPRIRSNIGEYLLEYQRRRKALLGRKAKQQIHQYGGSVLSTWETSCATIAKQCPVAVRLLSFFAFLDPEDIYLGLLKRKEHPPSAENASAEEDWERFLSPEVPFDDVLDEALEALSTYSLIEWREDQVGYSMHKLVHAWGFDRLGGEEQGRYSRNNLALLGEVVQDTQLDPVRKSRITPHISSSVARLREWEKASLKVPMRSLDTIRSLANFVEGTGQYETEYELRAFEEAERALVKEDDEAGWLRSLSDLAELLIRQGKYEAAEAMSRRALEGKEKVLGKEHPSTLISVSILALVLQDQGTYKAAEAMDRRALEGREKVLGKEHPETLTSVSNLASVLQYQGKYEAAEAMNRRALEGKEKVLGKEHPDTLISVSNLALVLRYQGKYEAAEAMSRRALEGKEKVLGKEHPETLTSVSNLTSVLQYQGKYEASEEMNRRALEGREKMLGKEHPDTLTSVYCLAYLLHQRGDFAAAMPLYERACAGYVVRPGRSHPTTMQCIRHMSSMPNGMSSANT